MSDLRQAAQQALEALTASTDLLGTMYLKMDAIAALRAALDQYDKDRVWIEERKAAWAKDKEIARKNAELERERHYTPGPCNIAEDGVCEALDCCKEQSTKCGEPVETIVLLKDLPVGKLIDTPSPSQRSENLKSREWRGLTEEEIYPLYSEPSSDAEMVEFARAIEAVLKERNA